MNRKLCILSLLLCLVLTACESQGSYDEGYEAGYKEGQREASYRIENLEDSSDSIYMDFDAAESLIERDGWYIVVEIWDYAAASGHSDGAFAVYPPNRSSWKANCNDSNFTDAYIDAYFETYNYDSNISSDDKFDYKKVKMIDTSEYSDAILEIGYDEWHEIALIRWTPGNLYAYEGMDLYSFEDFFVADSLGTYANENIKDNYSCFKIDER